jgi:glycosyltransferase involved in cell wall biosynthesis
MREKRSLSVAILMATYNGARYADEQIQSFKENRTDFILHWLDDQSSDGSREVVRSSAKRANIELREWHQPKHAGLPFSFFVLLENVEADIYLFSDQDDIWQPGKIDAVVESLSGDTELAVLCYSDSHWFGRGQPKLPRRSSQACKIHRKNEDQQFRRLLFGGCFGGHAQAFTRPLRERFLESCKIAREHAYMHDWWMHHLALMHGSIRVLWDAPAALYRRHEGSFGHRYSNAGRNVLLSWHAVQRLRLDLARHARGVSVVAMTLPADAKVTGILMHTRLAERLDKRHSPTQLVRLLQSGVLALPASTWLWLIAALLLSKPIPPRVVSRASLPDPES